MIFEILMKNVFQRPKMQSVRQGTGAIALAAVVLFSAAPSFAGTMCSKEVLIKNGSHEYNSELLSVMSEVMISNAFDPYLAFEVKSTRERCVDIIEADDIQVNKSFTRNGILGPSPTPRDGDVRTVTQTRADETRSWTYTYIDGQWVLTGYSFLPKAEEEAPEEP